VNDGHTGQEEGDWMAAELIAAPSDRLFRLPAVIQPMTVYIEK
jgi:hypothetical protein